MAYITGAISPCAEPNCPRRGYYHVRSELMTPNSEHLRPRCMIHARRLLAEYAAWERDGRPVPHTFVPASGSQDAMGVYTRCSVNGCELSPEQHPEVAP